MKTLQFIPVTMFFTGLLLIYCGFKDMTMVEVLRQNIGGLETPQDNSWQPNSNPVYNGVGGGTPQYVRPSMSGPGTF